MTSRDITSYTTSQSGSEEISASGTEQLDQLRVLFNETRLILLQQILASPLRTGRKARRLDQNRWDRR